MTKQLTMKQIADAMASAGGNVCQLDTSHPCVQILGKTESITSVIASLIESENLKLSDDLLALQLDYAVLHTERDYLRQRLDAAQNDAKQLRQSRDKRDGGIREHPLFMSEFEKNFKAAGDYIEGIVRAKNGLGGDASVSSDVNKPIAPHVTTQDAISEVMAAMHEDENDSFKARLEKFTELRKAEIIAKRKEIIAKAAAKVVADMRARFPAQNCSADSDGWIEWHGGECPVGAERVVQCKLRCGNIFDSMASKLIHKSYWRKDNHQYDIIAYRLAK